MTFASATVPNGHEPVSAHTENASPLDAVQRPIAGHTSTAGARVGGSVGELVGAVGDGDGASVGDVVGFSVGDWLGATGDAVGASVGDELGKSVGDAVGENVGCGVLHVLHSAS